MHTCFKTLLRRAFALPTAACLETTSVAQFLVPCLRPPPCRLPARRSQQRRFYSGQDLKPEQPPKYHTNLPLPPKDTRDDPDAWIEALEPGLPSHLRSVHNHEQGTFAVGEDAITARDISHLLIQARGWNDTDVLTTLGYTHGRWDAVLWIVKSIVDQPIHHEGAWSWVARPSSWPASESLDRITESRTSCKEFSFSTSSAESLEEITQPLTNIPNLGADLRKGALGQIWRSLGAMILIVISEEDKSNSVMLHVLQIIAHLHHAGVIPETIYQYNASRDHVSIHQPPTLHLLSTRILSALSDAAWLARESSADIEKKIVRTHYTIYGFEIPGSHHKLRVPELGPEVWLELVLWSSLQGGWISEGAALLQLISELDGPEKFTLICWSDIVKSMESETTGLTGVDWNRIKSAVDAVVRKRRAQPGERQLTERTVSTEIVAAFVDALVNVIRVGTGVRGVRPELVITYLKSLKGLLDRNQMGLGALSWDALLVRLAESGGLDTERNPSTMQSALRMVQPYGRELESTNMPDPSKPGLDKPLNYIFEPTAAPLGMLHRTLRSHITRGDFEGAVRCFRDLQIYTDTNKRRSMEQFFRNLGTSDPDDSDGFPRDFDSNISPVNFPSYYPQVPIPILAGFLDQATQSKNFDIGNWMIFSEDIDGPLITKRMYESVLLAPALIRFGTATRDRELLKEVLVAQSIRSKQGLSGMPSEVLSAFLESQIELRRWDSVQHVLRYMGSDSKLSCSIPAAVALTRTIMSFETGEVAIDDARKARDTFTALMSDMFGRALKLPRPWINTLLGMLASINPAWTSLCGPLFTGVHDKRVRMRADDFNLLLEAVSKTYGSLEGARLCQQWCRHIKTGGGWVDPAPGGVPALLGPRPDPITAQDVASDIVLDINGGEARSVCFRGRVTPNVSTFRTILSQMHYERREAAAGRDGTQPDDGSRRACLQWIAFNLYSMGLSKEALAEEVGTLGEDSPASGSHQGGIQNGSASGQSAVE